MKNELKNKAVGLRSSGHSFREIGLILNISKSTASVWCRQEVITPAGLARLQKLEDAGRARAKQTIAGKQRLLLDQIDQACGVLINKKYDRNDYKLFLALLYWCEGAKSGKDLDFVNSDPAMIRVYLFLLRNSFIINNDKLRARLHLHDYHNREEMLDYWSQVTAIPKNHFYVYNKPHTGINKKPGYKGCLSIRYGDSRIIKEVFLIMKRLENLPKLAGLVQW